MTPSGDERQRTLANRYYAAAFAFLAAVWLVYAVPLNSFAQNTVGTPTLLVILAAAWAANRREEIYHRYSGLILGLAVALVIIEAIDGFHLVICVFFVAGLALLGHTIQVCWNSQDFVKSARAEKQYAEHPSPPVAPPPSPPRPTVGPDGMTDTARKIVDEMLSGKA
jgi:hypothetical protein